MLQDTICNSFSLIWKADLRRWWSENVASGGGLKRVQRLLDIFKDRFQRKRKSRKVSDEKPGKGAGGQAKGFEMEVWRFWVPGKTTSCLSSKISTRAWRIWEIANGVWHHVVKFTTLSSFEIEYATTWLLAEVLEFNFNKVFPSSDSGWCTHCHGGQFYWKVFPPLNFYDIDTIALD